MLLSREDRAWVEAVALQHGFDLAGMASVPAGEADDLRFAEWVDAGYAGEMDWLARRNEKGELLRSDIRRSVPFARSVLVCAVNYNTAAPRSIDPAPPDRGWIARYAWSGRKEPDSVTQELPSMSPGSDYHEELLPRLEAIADAIRARFGESCITRAYVDTGPILERDYAARAGIGWIGRNTCVLNQQLGSWLLLGVIITSLELPQAAELLPAVDRCGTCTRCIEACPTDALHGSGIDGAPRLMDATRCIAYLTIEKKGSIDRELREPMGRHVFGCDICQDVCPWNTRAPLSNSGMLEPRPELVNPSLAWLGRMDGAAFNRAFRASPLERTRRKRILRNVAIAMGNSGEEIFREQLFQWTLEEDSVLVEAASWALQRLSALSPSGALAAHPLELDPAGPLD